MKFLRWVQRAVLVPKKPFDHLVGLVREALRDGSEPFKANVLLTIALLVFGLAVALPAILDFLVQIVRPTANPSSTLLLVLLIVAGEGAGCVWMLTTLEAKRIGADTTSSLGAATARPALPVVKPKKAPKKATPGSVKKRTNSKKKGGKRKPK